MQGETYVFYIIFGVVVAIIVVFELLSIGAAVAKIRRALLLQQDTLNKIEDHLAHLWAMQGRPPS